VTQKKSPIAETVKVPMANNNDVVIPMLQLHNEVKDLSRLSKYQSQITKTCNKIWKSFKYLNEKR